MPTTRPILDTPVHMGTAQGDHRNSRPTKYHPIESVIRLRPPKNAPNTVSSPADTEATQRHKPTTRHQCVWLYLPHPVNISRPCTTQFTAVPRALFLQIPALMWSLLPLDTPPIAESTAPTMQATRAISAHGMMPGVGLITVRINPVSTRPLAHRAIQRTTG